MNPESPRLRLSILGVVVLSLFAALFARLWYLQVMASEEYEVAAQTNAIRVVPVEAPRGRVLDRDGTVLVDNRVSIQVTIDRSALGRLEDDERASVLARLADALSRSGTPTTVEQLRERIADPRYSPYVPVPVAADVSEQLKIWIDEHADELPSVAAQRVAVRSYPYGQLLAHVLGYIGKINQEELDAREDSDKPYTLNDDIGKAGIERVYEDVLRGHPGVRRIEVDTDGNPIRVVEETPPVPGDDVVLTVDIDVQAVAEKALRDGLETARRRRVGGGNQANTSPAGATVVLSPQDGSVIAMASYPTFSPGDFIDGISNPEWEVLNDPVNHYPLNNRVVQGQYAPGSTFKLFTAYAGLMSGLIQPTSTVVDSGVYTVPNCSGGTCTFTNAGSRAYGPVSVREALTVSSDVFFYDLGARFWIARSQYGGPDAMQQWVEQFGLGERTGLALPSEARGRIPSPQQRKEFCQLENAGCIDDNWYTGDNVNTVIGQGDVLVTPLQLANGYASLANGGTRWIPQLVREVRDGVTGEVVERFEPESAGAMDLPPEVRQPIVDGLVGVTSREGGTAYGTFLGFPHDAWPVAGKTGTAEVNGKADTAVFAAFGPAGGPTVPQYALSVVMEESGFGGVAAAPVARRLFDVLSGTVELPPAPEGGRFDEGVEQLSPDPQATGDVVD